MAASPAMDPVRIVRGRESILAWGNSLAELCRRCDQCAAMDHLAYYLARPAFARKRPALVLGFAKEQEISPDRKTGRSSPSLQSAVLVYEHLLWGIGCRLYSSDYHGGNRTVIAPRSRRAEVAICAARVLMARGALLAQVSYEGDEAPAEVTSGMALGRGTRCMTRASVVIGYLQEDTFEATLANLGKHTRRNLRHYWRLTQDLLGATGTSAPDISRGVSRLQSHGCLRCLRR